MRSRHIPLQSGCMSRHHSVREWSLLIALVGMWGSSFMFIKIGVSTVPPTTLVASRLVLGALILLALMRIRGVKLPPWGAQWMIYCALGLVGNAIPFYLITWGQRVVDSALAGILMAVMPLATLTLAHYLVHGERMTARRVSGFAAGFFGIVLLMGPAALHGLGGAGTDLIYQLAVLCGALCYAANSVMARLLIKGDLLTASTATLLAAAAITMPLALLIDTPWTLSPSIASASAIIWLGIGPTAVATICYYAVIRLAGPTFMSLVNYLSPVVAVVLGIGLMHEHPGPNAYAGLAFILSGIALSQFRRAG
jgi:drug/metabolite transporter (DMT)-like permease